MGKTIDAVFRFLAVIAAALLLFITLSIGWSILARAIGVTSPVWTVQFTEYSLLWMTFLGTAWLLAKNKHIAISVLTQRLGRPANRTLGFIHSIVGALLCGSLCFFGAKLTLDHLQRHVVGRSGNRYVQGYCYCGHPHRIRPFDRAVPAQFLELRPGRIS